MKCAACQATEGLRGFGVIVDGKPLRTQIPLCQSDGDRFLLRVGNQEQHKPGGDA